MRQLRIGQVPAAALPLHPYPCLPQRAQRPQLEVQGAGLPAPQLRHLHALLRTSDSLQLHYSHYLCSHCTHANSTGRDMVWEHACAHM